MSSHDIKRPETVGLWAGTLAATEVGIGSLLHGLHLPLTGTLLSLNQAAFLTRATRTQAPSRGAKSLPLEISSITALLKSFSPVGKKLTPMLAIAAQGALFSAALYTLGANLLGVLVGAALLSTWGIVQPVLLASLMFWALSDAQQDQVTNSWQKLTGDIPFLTTQNILTAVLVFLILKALAAVTVCYAAWKLDSENKFSWMRYLEESIAKATQGRNFAAVPNRTSHQENQLFGWTSHPLIQATRDLKNPLVLLSTLILIALSVLAKSEFSSVAWISMRALGSLYVTFVVLRLLPLEKWLAGDEPSKKALKAAFNQLQQLQVSDPQPATTESVKPQANHGKARS